MKIQSSVLVHLGFGKYVRSDQVTAVIPIEEERGPGRRTFVHLHAQDDPIVASRAEDTIVRDLVQEPREVTQSRQQQEILQDLLVYSPRGQVFHTKVLRSLNVLRKAR